MHEAIISIFSFFSFFKKNFEIIKQNINGIVIEKIKNNNLRIYGLSINLVTNDKIIKWRGVWTKVQSVGFANKFSWRAKINPYVASKSPLAPPPVPSSFKKNESSKLRKDKKNTINSFFNFKKLII